MALSEKDFKVKNGIQVSGDAVIGGTITAASPTLGSHVVTLEYFTEYANSGFKAQSVAPVSPTDGDNYFDTATQRLNVFYDGSWITMASVEDTQNIPQHIHDTSIDGSGLIVSRFTDAASPTSPQGAPVDGGGVSTTSWDSVLDGGSVSDNFN
jgi:hypothetical protein